MISRCKDELCLINYEALTSAMSAEESPHVWEGRQRLVLLGGSCAHQVLGKLPAQQSPNYGFNSDVCMELCQS